MVVEVVVTLNFKPEATRSPIESIETSQPECPPLAPIMFLLPNSTQLPPGLVVSGSLYSYVLIKPALGVVVVL